MLLGTVQTPFLWLLKNISDVYSAGNRFEGAYGY